MASLKVREYRESPQQEEAWDRAEFSGLLMQVQDGELSPEAALQQAKYLNMQNSPVAKEMKLFETLEAMSRR